MNARCLLGLDDRYIRAGAMECPLHVDVIAPFEALRLDAAAAGFRLRAASGYRSFERQLTLFNAKAERRRPVMDNDGLAPVPESLTGWPLLEAILRWSALPGTSRHHWGTDVDVYDAAAVEPDYEVQLSAAEVGTGGCFDALHCWLDERISAGRAHGFFRPYDRDRGGVAPERWHLSYAPLGDDFGRAFDRAALREQLAAAEIALRDTVLAQLDHIVERFVVVPPSREDQT